MYLKIIPYMPRYIHVQWIIPSLLYQTRKKNSFVFKGLTDIMEKIISDTGDDDDMEAETNHTFVLGKLD